MIRHPEFTSGGLLALMRRSLVKTEQHIFDTIRVYVCLSLQISHLIYYNNFFTQRSWKFFYKFVHFH